MPRVNAPVRGEDEHARTNDDQRWAAAPDARPAGRALWKVFAVAAVVRLACFPFAENKQCDAPMRSLLAERMNTQPGAAADPRGFFQYGPLPIEVMRPFMLVDRDARRSSRWPSLLAGLAVFAPFFSLASRMGATEPAALMLAGLALALSSLHVQVSTTAASEALYLFLFVSTLDRLHAALSARRFRDFLLAGLLGSLAAVTRYDMWLSLPSAAAAALWCGRRDRRPVTEVALFLGASAVFPVAYLAWLRATTGDPLFFAHFIRHDHATMAAAVSSRLGPGIARLRQIVIWLLAFAAAMTPLPFVALAGVLRHPPQLSVATRVVLIAALAPIVVYLIQGLVFGQFEPLARFAIVPGTVLLPIAAVELARWRSAPRSPRARIGLSAGLAVALGLMTALLAHAGPGRIWGGAESFEAVTRLDPEDRALARFLEAHVRPEEGVFIDPLGFSDIAIAHAARIPAGRTATLAWTRTPSPTVAETRARTFASWFAAHDWSWGRTPIPDWPADGVRLGRWRVARFWPAAPR